MKKNKSVIRELESMETRVRNLETTSQRLKNFDGLNNGHIIEDTEKRLTKAKLKLKQFIEDNLEYII
jgi:hypothetical protein